MTPNSSEVLFYFYALEYLEGLINRKEIKRELFV